MYEYTVFSNVSTVYCVLGRPPECGGEQPGPPRLQGRGGLQAGVHPPRQGAKDQGWIHPQVQYRQTKCSRIYIFMDCSKYNLRG